MEKDFLERLDAIERKFNEAVAEFDAFDFGLDGEDELKLDDDWNDREDFAPLDDEDELKLD